MHTAYIPRVPEDCTKNITLLLLYTGIVHYSDAMMSAMTYQINGVSIV